MTLEALVKEWRERARGQGAIYASGLYECAEELSSALAGIARQQDAVKAEGAHCGYCPTCDLTWNGPYTDCPGCLASAGMKAISDLQQQVAAAGIVCSSLSEQIEMVKPCVECNGLHPVGKMWVRWPDRGLLCTSCYERNTRPSSE